MSSEPGSVTPVHAGNALLQQPGHIQNGNLGSLCVSKHTSRMHQSTEVRMHLSNMVNKIFSSGLDTTQVYAKVVWACARPANAAVLALELVSACSHTALSRRTGPAHTSTTPYQQETMLEQKCGLFIARRLCYMQLRTCVNNSPTTGR